MTKHEDTATLPGVGSSDVLYACFVTECWETWLNSMHRTKAGAWKAGRCWLLDQLARDDEGRRLIGKDVDYQPWKYRSFHVAQMHVGI